MANLNDAEKKNLPDQLLIHHMLSMIQSTWDVPMESASKKIHSAIECIDVQKRDVISVAWESRHHDYAKMSYLTNTRFNRSIPTWELQAPENEFNLATLLQVLDEVDESCVLTVRKIHKIGLNSAQILREHFSQFGEVDRVMLLPSRPKATSQALTAEVSVGSGKIRPASMAFVVMRSRQPAIVARLNEIHVIEGHPIQVQLFKRDPTSVAEATPTTVVSESNTNHEMQLASWLDEMSTMITTSYRTSAKFIN